MLIEQFVVGPLETNCYLIYESAVGEAVLIDPGSNAKEIIESINSKNLKLNYIFLTHGHFDHFLAAEEIKNATGAQIAIHGDDAHCLGDARANLSVFMGQPQTICEADILLNDGDHLEPFDVIHTPGHSAGGVCLLSENHLFCGDTLFFESIGRYDFGNYDDLIASVKKLISTLPEDTICHPGHGNMTTIGHERDFNPFLGGNAL